MTRADKVWWRRTLLAWGVAAVVGFGFGWCSHRPNPVDPQPPAVRPAHYDASDGQPRSYTVTARVTAYCPCARCCGQYADGQTATGADASTPGVAVAPSAIPYGSRVRIPGVPAVLTADDTGGAMRQAWRARKVHVDLRMPTHEAARQWGVRVVPITVYPPIGKGAFQ